jgi:hypothetical protein
MIDLNDMSNLTLAELIPDDNLNDAQLSLVLRALECKLLKIPERIEKANRNVDFSHGWNEGVMIDIHNMTTEMYELVMCIRECLPLKKGIS